MSTNLTQTKMKKCQKECKPRQNRKTYSHIRLLGGGTNNFQESNLDSGCLDGFFLIAPIGGFVN